MPDRSRPSTIAEIDRQYPLIERVGAMISAFEVGYCLIELLFDERGEPFDYWFVEVSDAFVDVTGFPEPQGRRISEIAPGHEQKFLDIYGSVARTGVPVRFTLDVAVLGGRTFDIRACRVGGEGSRVVGIWGTDVSEQAARNQRQRDYIAMVSHDLGTPMTVVRAQAQILRRREAYDAARVDAIVAQIDRMERLLAGLRNVVRAEHGWLERGLATVDLTLLVLEAVERGRMQSPAHHLTLEADGPVIGYWDRERIEQILDNLIGNAIKYSPGGGAVTVRLAGDADRVRLTITDEGVGIAPEALPMLFDRFYRASEGGAIAGMGLGLYIVRTLVQAKGGTVGVTSEVGEGSTFTVDLPWRTEPPGEVAMLMVRPDLTSHAVAEPVARAE